MIDLVALAGSFKDELHAVVEVVLRRRVALPADLGLTELAIGIGEEKEIELADRLGGPPELEFLVLIGHEHLTTFDCGHLLRARP